MRMVLGIDGGASKTHALLLGEDGAVLGFGKGGCANHQSCGLAEAEAEIEKAVQEALNGRTAPIDLACYCLAGADFPSDYTMLQNAMEKNPAARRIVVKNDTMAAMRAGLSRPWGVVVICGSGFNSAARTPEGKEIVMPGLGAMSGDWGGGYALAEEMIRLIMRAWDTRGAPTLLTEAVLDHFDLRSVEELLYRLYHDKIDHQQVMSMVPLLFETAEKGDQVAIDLVKRMGVETGVTARSLIRRGGMEALNPEVVLGGSVYKGQGSLLIDTVKAEIHTHYPGVMVKQPKYEPVVGAALLALEALGITIGQAAIKKMESTLPKGLFIGDSISI